MNSLLLKLAGLCSLALAFFATPAVAAADPVAFNFDEAIINLGNGSGPQGLKLIDPDATPADDPATLRGEVDTATDAFSAAASDFTFPQKTTQVSGQNVVVTISANAAITGTFDADTGASDITVPVTVSATVLGTTCSTSFPLDLKTTGTLTEPGGSHDAAPFDSASGEGSVYSTFTVPNSTGGAICSAVDGAISGAGDIWLSGTGGIDEGIISVYPGDEGTTFETTDGGWAHSDNYPALCGLIPGALCPAMAGSHETANGATGATDGSLRDTASGLTVLPEFLGQNATGVWTSPEFTYDGADGEPAEELSFALARKSAVSGLLLQGNATWKVDLVNTGDSSVTPLVPSGPATDAGSWTVVSGSPLSPDALTLGGKYRIVISTTVSVTLIGLFPGGTFDYDEVALTARRATPTGPTGPTGPTDPTGPTGPTDPTGPTGPTSPTGPTGPTSPTGPTGPTSPTGPTGPTGPSGPGTNPPNAVTAIYNGKFLFLRLKCPKRFKPRCLGRAVGVTRKSPKRMLARPMTGYANARQKPGKWKVVKLRVKPKYKRRIATYAKRPNRKLLVVRQTVHAKRFKHGKRKVVFHKYKVRTASR